MEYLHANLRADDIDAEAGCLPLLQLLHSRTKGAACQIDRALGPNRPELTTCSLSWIGPGGC